MIDLLPDSFTRARRQRRLRLMQGSAAAVAIVVATTWAGLAYRQLSSLSAQVRFRQAQVADGRHRIQAHTVAEGESKRLQALLARRAALELPVPATAVVSLIGHLLPESVTLTRVLMTTPPPVLEVTPPRPRTGMAAVKTPEPLRLELEGVALSDQDVARLVGDLAAQGLFSNAKLAKSRQMTVGGLPRYGFVVSLELSPAARYEVASVASEDR
jgi:hypothetical protein